MKTSHLKDLTYRMKTMRANNHRYVLEKAFEGTNIKDLAFRLKTTPGALYNVKYGIRKVSALRAIEIEKESEAMGHKIPRTILRPDIFGTP